jgi:hypothetical protein
MPPTQANNDAGEEADEEEHILDYEPGAQWVAINYKSGNRRLSYFSVIKSAKKNFKQKNSYRHAFISS